MKHMSQALKRRRKTAELEKAVLKENPEFLRDEQLNLMFLGLSFVLGWTILFVLLSYLPPDIIPLHPLQLVLIVYSAAVLVILKVKKNNISKPLPLMYLSALVILFCLFFLGRRFEGGYLPVSYLVGMTLVPLFVLDNMKRKSAVLAVFVVITGLIAFLAPRPGRRVDYVLIQEIFSLLSGSVAAMENQHYKLRLGTLYTEADTDRRTDSLTGLANRYELFDFLAKSTQSEDWPIRSMYMLDVDHFKQFNDTYGHQAGDECLKQIGSALKEMEDSYSIRFFRYGGEEFLGIGMKGESSAADAVASAIKEKINALNIPFEASPFGRVTVSIGYTVDDSRYEKMIQKADEAMYRAKNRGRNQTAAY